MIRPARFTIFTVALSTVALVAVSLGIAQQPQPPRVPSPQPITITAPQPAAQPAPWANKFFMPGIEKNPSQPAPELLTHEFGSVPFGTVCAQKFVLTNPYEVPMQVLDVRVECGCLKAYPPAKVLQPNETAEFLVTMDTGRFRGANAKRMYVTFGPNALSTARLEFRATSREDVTLSPGLVDFGTVPQGAKSPVRTVSLKYDGKQKDWKVLEVVKAPAGLEVEVKEASRGGLFAVNYYLTAMLKDTAPAGTLSEQIVLKTNDPASPLVTVSVAGVVKLPVEVVPEKVTFRDVAVGAVKEYKVMIKGTGSNTFRVTAEAPESDDLRVEGLIPQALTLHYPTIRFQPKVAGPFRHEVRFKTTLGGPPLVVVIDGEAK